MTLKCFHCEEEIDAKTPVSVVAHPGGTLDYYCEACTVVMMMEAGWQKEHQERKE